LLISHKAEEACSWPALAAPLRSGAAALLEALRALSAGYKLVPPVWTARLLGGLLAPLLYEFRAFGCLSPQGHLPDGAPRDEHVVPKPNAVVADFLKNARAPRECSPAADATLGSPHGSHAVAKLNAHISPDPVFGSRHTILPEFGSSRGHLTPTTAGRARPGPVKRRPAQVTS
jgi:hypothetical protein